MNSVNLYLLRGLVQRQSFQMHTCVMPSVKSLERTRDR
jgi:hypothetical protein